MKFDNREDGYPLPAIVDAQQPEDIEMDDFCLKYHLIKAGQAKQSVLALCAALEVKSPEDLVSQKGPHEGPKLFIEQSEAYMFLPNFEELTLRAVQSNAAAASRFLEWFVKFQFIQMEFYDPILNAALKTDKLAVLGDPSNSLDLRCFQHFLADEVESKTAILSLLKEVSKTGEWKKIGPLEKQYKVAFSMNPNRTIFAFEQLLDHYKYLLKKIKEFFAEN